MKEVEVKELEESQSRTEEEWTTVPPLFAGSPRCSNCNSWEFDHYGKCQECGRF